VSDCVVLELVPLRGDKDLKPNLRSSVLSLLNERIHDRRLFQTRPIGVVFKISDESPASFYMGFPQRWKGGGGHHCNEPSFAKFSVMVALFVNL